MTNLKRHQEEGHPYMIVHEKLELKDRCIPEEIVFGRF